MPQYMVEIPHEEQHCTPAVNLILERGPEFLSKFDWGCEHGVHSGWAVIEAGSEAEARNMLPAFLRKEARIVRVEKREP